MITVLMYSGLSYFHNYVLWIFRYLMWRNSQQGCCNYWLCWLISELFLICPCLVFCLENRFFFFFWEHYFSQFLAAIFFLVSSCLFSFSSTENGRKYYFKGVNMKSLFSTLMSWPYKQETIFLIVNFLNIFFLVILMMSVRGLMTVMIKPLLHYFK